MRVPPGTILRARAVLFDFDGTLVDSMALIDDLWSRWGARFGISGQEILAVSHGRRMHETMALFRRPGMDIPAECRWLIGELFARNDGLVAVPGALELLRALPRDRWAIVTSSFRDLVPRWLDAVGLPAPDVMVTTEDVENGKPAPDCFRLGAGRLGVRPEETIAFEDAHAGFESARSAGARVIGLATTHPAAMIEPEDWIEDYRGVTVAPPDAAGLLTLRFG